MEARTHCAAAAVTLPLLRAQPSTPAPRAGLRRSPEAASAGAVPLGAHHQLSRCVRRHPAQLQLCWPLTGAHTQRWRACLSQLSRVEPASAAPSRGPGLDTAGCTVPVWSLGPEQGCSNALCHLARSAGPRPPRPAALTARPAAAQAAAMPAAAAPGGVRAEVGALLRLAVPVSSAFLLNKSISFVGVLFVRCARRPGRLAPHAQRAQRAASPRARSAQPPGPGAARGRKPGHEPGQRDGLQRDRRPGRRHVHALRPGAGVGSK